jgi:hypothetical protein
MGSAVREREPNRSRAMEKGLQRLISRHARTWCAHLQQNQDGRDKPGHDVEVVLEP